jgi:hypothetical protein
VKSSKRHDYRFDYSIDDIGKLEEKPALVLLERDLVGEER